MKSEKFQKILRGNELIAWESLKCVIQQVLGNNREENFKVLVENMMQSFKAIGISMSLKLHFLNNHLDEFSKQLPTESDEQGERFHQTTIPMEKRFKGEKIDAMLGEVCWWSQKSCLYDRSQGQTDYILSSEDEQNYDSDNEPNQKKAHSSAPT